MFTGLVDALGTVKDVHEHAQGRIHGKEIVLGHPYQNLTMGESIALNGACISVTKHHPEGTFTCFVSHETLKKTTLGQLNPHDKVNLERAMRMGDRLGGHWVTGHVDDVATIAQINADAESTDLWVQVAPRWMPYIVYKGSVVIDGVSLTVNEVLRDGSQFRLTLIPITLEHTTLSGLKKGSVVNMEVDILAKYVESLFPHQHQGSIKGEGL